MKCQIIWVVVKIMVPIRVILGLYWGYIGVIWGMLDKKMETTIMGCQNYGLFLDPYCNTAPDIKVPKKGP